MDSASIIKSLESVTRKWTKQRKQEERGRAMSRCAVFTRMYEMSIKDAAWSVMPAAYAKASAPLIEGGDRLPAHTRQIMYAARGEILKLTGRRDLSSAYFSQVIVPEYVDSHRKETATWDIVYDARGHFAEPHTEFITPLGTLDVRQYLADIRDHVIKSRLHAANLLTPEIVRFPTYGPQYRFGAILFIKKEGFMPLFPAVKLAQRYDLGIMSTKGMPVTACRHLADELCGKHDIPLLVLHDFDKAGFSIAGTLMGVEHYDISGNPRSTRYDYRHNFDVIDLGLRLEDVEEYGLESEPVHYRNSDPSDNLEENGATPEEIKFLTGSGRSGQRVELNAFTSGDFIKWIEAKLKANKIKKVIPDAETLEAAYRRAIQIEVVRERLPAIIQVGKKAAKQATLPKGLTAIIRKALKTDPALPWDQAVATVAAANCKKRKNGAAIEQAESAAPADETFTKPAPPAKTGSEKRPRKKEVAPASPEDRGGIIENLAQCGKLVTEAPDGWMDQFVKLMGRTEDGTVTTDRFLAYCKKRRAHEGDSACSKTDTEVRE